MAALHVRAALRQSHLNAGRTPRYKLGQFTFANALQRFVHLRRIHFALNDVQYRNVAVMIGFVRSGGHHHVFRLQQTTHHVQNGGFANVDRLLSVDNLISEMREFSFTIFG